MADEGLIVVDEVLVDRVRALGDALRARGWTLAAAESCTGGLVAGACTAPAGASDWFLAGFVTYSNEAKQALLGVPAALIAAHGAVSAPVAEAMARGALERGGARLALSVTGIAGPGGGSAAKPVGTVWLGFAWAGAQAAPVAAFTECLHLAGDRAVIRAQTVVAVLARALAIARDGDAPSLAADPAMRIAFDARLSANERAEWWRALTDALPEDDWVDALADGTGSERWRTADVAVVANPQPGRLAACTQLKLVQSLWAGVDRLMADATLPAAVPLARMVDPAMNRAMAETATWAVLSLHRRAFDYAAQQRQTTWRQLPQKRADEVAVLVLGLGEMGRTTAQRLAGLGYAVSGWSARPRAVEGVACTAGWAALPSALGAAEVVVNLLPLTEDTRGLFDRARFAQMRPGAGLVNLARGAHVVEPDLLEALNAGRLGHAVLDVFDTEPLPATHVFWFHPRITVWPHAAAQTDLRTAAAVVAANVDAVRRGEAPANLVDRARGY